MSVALRLYEQLTEAGEDKTRASLIADAIWQLEERRTQHYDLSVQTRVITAEWDVVREIRASEERLSLSSRDEQFAVKDLLIALSETKRDFMCLLIIAAILQTCFMVGVVLKVAHLI